MFWEKSIVVWILWQKIRGEGGEYTSCPAPLSNFIILQANQFYPLLSLNTPENWKP